MTNNEICSLLNLREHNLGKKVILMKKVDNVLRLAMILAVFITCLFVDHAWCQQDDATGNPEKAITGKLAAIEDVLKQPVMGAIALTSDKQGSESYTTTSDGEFTVSSCLQTYGAAELSVTVNGEKVISWARQSDRDPAKLIVNGEEIAESNVEVSPGDFTPTTQTTRLKLKKGDKVTLNLSGNFGSASAHLSISGPGIEKKDNTPGTADAIGAPGTTVTGSGGGFLWKPVSESRGGVCVILLPSKYRHEQFDKKLWINGQANEVKEWRDTYANGNRMHIFLKKKGKDYGGPVKIIFGLANGGKIEWNVAEGGRRTEK